MTLFRPVLVEFATLIPFVACLRRNFSITFFLAQTLRHLVKKITRWGGMQAVDWVCTGPNLGKHSPTLGRPL